MWAHLEQHDDVECHAYEADHDLGQVASHHCRVAQHASVKHLQQGFNSSPQRTFQHSTAQHSTAQHGTAQHSAAH